MLFQLYSEHAVMQIIGWVLVFCGLILMNEIGRAKDALGLLAQDKTKEALEKLFEEYDEDGPEVLLSGAMMAYRFGEMDKALSCLQQIRISNFRPFIRAVLRDEELETYWKEAMENRRMGGYQYNTVGHLLHIADEWDFLRPHSVAFLQWAYEAVKRPVRRKS